MTWFKRIFLFMVVNLLIIITITTVLRLLGVDHYLTANGIDYQSLFIFCLVWGMGGAFISLALSKVMAKWMMGVKLVDPNTRDGNLRDLVQTVHNLARSAGLSKMPEVGFYNSPEINAFATGPTKNNALVAVSSGLMQRLGKPELEGVLGHEVAHIANGDMVTLTLVQGIVNAFVMFFARVAAFAVSQAMRRNDDEGPSYFMQTMLIIAFEIAFGLLGMMVVAWFSRFREYRADSGGARLAGTPKMIGALEALRRTTELVDKGHPSLAAFKINGRRGGLAALFSTHPPLEQRIQRLKELRV